MALERRRLSTAITVALHRDVTPLIDRSVHALELDAEQATRMEALVHWAWLVGLRTAHLTLRDIAGDLVPVSEPSAIDEEFQMIIAAVDRELAPLTPWGTLQGWYCLARARAAGERFWEMEVATAGLG